jgi:hypothetical protein
MPLNAFSSAVIRRGGRIPSADSLTAKPGQAGPVTSHRRWSYTGAGDREGKGAD